MLSVGGIRGGETGKMPMLILPPGIAEARLQLNLKESDYIAYRVSLRAAEGDEEIFSRQNLKPGFSKSGASLMLVVPAGKLADGDYIVTVSGIAQDGEIDDLSKAIFRVRKR
jgi:hypothetical protein